MNRRRTIAEGVTLRDLLRNMRNNHQWDTFENRKELGKAIEKYATAFYLAVRKEEPTTKVEVETGVGRATLNKWKKKPKILPAPLQDYKKSILPRTEEEKLDFTYVLAAFARSLRHPVDETEKVFGRTPHDSNARERLISRVTNVLGKAPYITRGVVRIVSKPFVQTLGYNLPKLEEYMQDDASRVQFLQGIFDVSKAGISSRGGRELYKLNLPTKELFNLTVMSLFELGIYPRLNLSEGKFILHVESKDDLHKLADLELLVADEDVARIRSFELPSQSSSVKLDTYYAIRRIVTKRVEQGLEVGGITLSDDFGINDHTLVYRWVKDLTKPPSKGRRRIHGSERPNVVRRYEALVDYLGLPNVFLREGVVQRNEKLFFTNDEDTYLLHFNVKEADEEIHKHGKVFVKINDRFYLLNIEGDYTPLPSEHKSLMSRLERTATRDSNTRRDGLVFNRNGVITISTDYWERQDIPITVGDTDFTFTSEAIGDYFDALGIERRRLSLRNIQRLEREIEVQKSGGYSTAFIQFDLEGNIVVGCRKNRSKTKTLRPVVFNNKGYIPVDGKVYTLSPRLKRSMSSRLVYGGMQGDDLEGVQAELRLVLAGVLEAKLLGLEHEGQVVTAIKRKYEFHDYLSLDFEHTSYIFINRALMQYFTRFSVEPQPLSTENIIQLGDELEKELGDDDDVIKNVALKVHDNIVYDCALSIKNIGTWRSREGIEGGSSNILGYENDH